MAIAATLFDSFADTTGGTTVLCNSKTYTSGRLYLFGFQSTGATNLVPTLAGLTFTEIGRASTGANASIVILFVAKCTSTTTGQVSVALAGGASGLEYNTAEITGHNNTTPFWPSNFATGSGSLAAAFSVTLPNAVLSANDLTIAFAGIANTTASLTKGTGWTAGTKVDYATPVAGGLMEWRLNDRTPDYTYTPGNTSWAEVAVEILEASVSIPAAALVGTTAGTGTLSGSLSVPKPLVGATAGVGSVTAAFDPRFSGGSVTGVGSMTGDLTVSRFQGSVTGTGSATASLTTQIRMAGTLSGVGTATAAFDVRLYAQPTQGVGSMTGLLKIGALLNGITSGVGSAQASLRTGAGLAGRTVGWGAVYLRWLSPGSGLPIEVWVCDGTNPDKVLAQLHDARKVRWYDPLNKIGSGSFMIPTSSVKATADILARGNYVRFRLHGEDRYGIWIESPERRIASINGKSGEYWNIKGRGPEAYLTRAVWAPGSPTLTLPAAGLLDYALTAAQARGILPNMSWDFDSEADSEGTVWDDTGMYDIDDGESYLNLLAQLPALGIDTTMTPDLVLRAFVDGGLGDSLIASVVFEQARHIRSDIVQAFQDVDRVTRIWVKGSNGFVTQVFGDESDPRRSPREGFMEVTTTSEPSVIQQAGEVALAQAEADANAYKIPMLHGTRPGELEPYLDYGKGDYVGANFPGYIDHETARVVALTIAGDDSGGYTVDVDLNSAVEEDLVRLKRQVDAMSNSVLGAA